MNWMLQRFGLGWKKKLYNLSVIICTEGTQVYTRRHAYVFKIPKVYVYIQEISVRVYIRLIICIIRRKKVFAKKETLL